MSTSRLALAIAVVTLACHLPLAAEVPRSMHVQGRLADSAGVALDSGAYEFTFRIFDSPSGGLELWPGGAGEQFTLDVDQSGLWSVDLGSTLPLSPELFAADSARWLEISVAAAGGTPEVLGRLKLQSEAYAFHAASSDVAANALLLEGAPASGFAAAAHQHPPGDIAPQGDGSGLDADLLDGRNADAFADSVHTHAGLWSINGANYYYNGGRVGVGTTSPEQMLHVLRGASTATEPNSANIAVFEADNTGYISIITPDFAERGILFGQPSNNQAGGIIYNNSLTPDGLQFRTRFNVPRMVIEPSGRVGIGTITGAGMLQVSGAALNSSVVLPDSSIGSKEIMDEPGIAATVSGTIVTLASTTMQDLASLSLNAPVSGYVVVEANCYGLTHGTTGRNLGVVQIDKTSGGDIAPPYSVSFGLVGYANTNLANSFPVMTRRVYFETAGPHTYILEGAQVASNGTGAVTRVANVVMTATFYPTSYGPVSTVVSQSDAAGFVTAAPVTFPGGSTGYQVDLRELELRAARARAAAEKAEREYLEAQAGQVAPSTGPDR
jgi:hypothetical protein